MNRGKVDPKWWDLHLRKARGGILSADEAKFYEATLKELYESEEFPGQLAALKRLREKVTELEQVNARLKAALQKHFS